jgi:two-component system chemotaxis sensor kinase CheA
MIDDDSFSEIKQIFIEEADEGLDIMESGLLELNDGECAVELINDIFRAAHSIKGGSATFGFNQISEFTHLMETLLDEMRDGSRPVTPDCIQVLLESVDVLREMMEAIKADRQQDSGRAREVSKLLEEILANKSGAVPSTSSTPAPAEAAACSAPAASAGGSWKISFTPAADMLRGGNDPGRLFRELGELGHLTVVADHSALPGLEEMDPEACYVSWQLTLDCEEAIEQAQIEEVFDWVIDECKLVIEAPATAGGTQNTPDEAADTAAKEAVESGDATDAAAADKPAPVAARAPAADNSRGKAPVAKRDGGSIRVGIDKIDSLLNLVGELVITQSMLNRCSSEEMIQAGDSQVSDLLDGLSQLETNARELQDVAMKMRMLPIKTTFSRFPRLVHDLSLQLSKKIELKIVGEHTELDKTVLEKIGDPLVHLVRNALDHGIEKPESRVAAGKPETGVLTLSARHEAGNIIIEVSDDGAGICSDKLLAKAREKGVVGPDEKISAEAIPYLIFHPGFSTAQEVSDVSGRGVGMDVVKRNIQDLGGRVEVKTEVAKGSTFTIRLPLTLAILDGQLVNINDSTYVIPLLSIIETVVVDESRLNIMAAESPVYSLRNEYIPIINMVHVLSGNKQAAGDDQVKEIVGKLLMIVESGGKLVGLVVDDLLDQQQVVLKSLDANYQQIQGMAGATILGDGTVSLIIDIPGLIETCFGGEENSALREMAAA